MAVPKKRKPKSRRNQRRSHHALTAAQLVRCANCGKYRRPHAVCPNCGMYKGKQVVSADGKAIKSRAKAKNAPAKKAK